MHDALTHPSTHQLLFEKKENVEFRHRLEKPEIIPLVLFYRRILAFYRIGNKSCARKFKPFARLYPFGSMALIQSLSLSLSLNVCFVEWLFEKWAEGGKRERERWGWDPFLQSDTSFWSHSRESFALFTCLLCRRRITNDCVVRLYQSL